MSVTVQKIRELPGEKSKTTTFIVCDDREQTWSLVKAESIEKAVEKARKQGYDPCYVVEERLATDVRGITDDGQQFFGERASERAEELRLRGKRRKNREKKES